MKTLMLLAITASFLAGAEPIVEKTQSRWKGNLAQYAALGGLMAADYAITEHGVNAGIGHEGNAVVACATGGHICVGKYLAFNGAMFGSLIVLNELVAPRVGRRGQRIIRFIGWGAVGTRGAVVGWSASKVYKSR